MKTKGRGGTERADPARGRPKPRQAGSSAGDPRRIPTEVQGRTQNQTRAATARTTEIIAAIAALAEPILKDRGLVLDRIEYRDRGKSAVVQVFIDRPGGGEGGADGGVGIQDCVDVTRELSPTLDVHDVVRKSYTLEVSSPGLDRPLSGADDFRRFAGRRAALTLRRAMEGGSKLVGVLRGVEDEGVEFEMRDGRIVRIPLEAIAKARLEP